ncbi:MAG: hypothetical protein LBV41_03025 [Cytophagaceae bacterium]|jgi:hypothetical protein|nr:hypothetical protein [Cytophagaceae bacterium]
MATITLEYDVRNKKVNTLLRAIMKSGATPIDAPRKKTGLDEALEDVRQGKVTRLKNIENPMEEILE